MIRFEGVAALNAALTGMTEVADRETRRAVAEGLAAIQRQAQINSTARPGPRVQTGAHRRGIRTTPVQRVGDHQWGGSVGPTMVYSRRLELGGGNWRRGVKFPYFSPAIEHARRVALPVIFKRAWDRASRRAAA